MFPQKDPIHVPKRFHLPTVDPDRSLRWDRRTTSAVLSAVPGPGYDQDLSDCSTLAKAQKAWNPETRTQAAIGATLGALAGLADNDVSNTNGAIAGAVVGGAVGAASGALDTRDTRKNTLIQCLRDRGHPVAG